MEANAPGNVPGLQEAEARFYVEEMLQGRFPATKPQLPGEILAVFSALASTRGAEGTKAAFVLGNHAEAIIATVYEPRTPILRRRTLEWRTVQLLGVFAAECIPAQGLPESVFRTLATRLASEPHPHTLAVQTAEELGRLAVNIHYGWTRAWETHPKPLAAAQRLHEARPHLTTLITPQAVATRTNALYGAFTALCPAMPISTQLRVLLRWCDTL